MMVRLCNYGTVCHELNVKISRTHITTTEGLYSIRNTVILPYSWQYATSYKIITYSPSTRRLLWCIPLNNRFMWFAPSHVRDEIKFGNKRIFHWGRDILTIVYSRIILC